MMPGLNGSTWASANKTRSTHSKGDWTCISCSTRNYYWREQCLHCAACPHDKNSKAKTNAIANRLARSNTQLHQVPRHPLHQLLPTPLPTPNPPTNPTSNRSRESLLHHLDASSSSSQAQAQIPGAGLLQSRWAPWKAGNASIDLGETYTKVRTIQTPRQHSPSHELSKAPDLGLPYQVQHCILMLMERMLEEACYEFAYRWMPQQLMERGWDCAEAVEMANWRDFLPSAVPVDTIKPFSNHYLAEALADAVKIRNAAVHRHFCDNCELRKMALQGENLMLMLSDNTRKEKFRLLWASVGRWMDSSSDPHAARAKLEHTLREICEKPIDDMDWTPNSMLLEEVPLQLNATSLRDLPDADEMELDID